MAEANVLSALGIPVLPTAQLLMKNPKGTSLVIASSSLPRNQTANRVPVEHPMHLHPTQYLSASILRDRAVSPL